MKRSILKILLPVLCLAFIVSWYVTLSISFINVPGSVEGTDFHWFYSVGKVWRLYGPGHVYDLELAAPIQAEVAGVDPAGKLLLLPNHPPFVYPAMALLAALPFRTAYLVNLACAWVLTALVMIVVYKLLVKLSWPRLSALLFIGGMLLFEPFVIGLLRGQDMYLLLIGGLLFLCGLLDRKDWLAGVGLGLILVRPQIALLLVLPFLFRQRRVLLWFLVTAVVLGIYSFLQVGWQGSLGFFRVLLLSTGVEAHGWDEVMMYDLVGLLIRLFPAMNVDIIHVIGWVVFGMSLVLLCIVWWKARAIRVWHVALAVSLSLFSAPHLHYHDLSLLLVSVLGLVVVSLRTGRLTHYSASLLPLFVSVLLVVGELWLPAHYPLSYLLIAAFPVLTWYLERDLVSAKLKPVE